MTMRTLPIDAVRRLAVAVLEANGLSAAQAAAVADVVTRAEADECRSHGLYRLPGYVAALRSGRVNCAARPALHRMTPGLVRVDGDGGFAPAAIDAGRGALVEAARRTGIAALAVVHCHHFSALWADIEPVVEQRLVCWAFVLGQCSVVPSGGANRLMGTNPIAFGWPRPDARPFIFDFATSAAARGEVELRMLAQEVLPVGWAVDAEGEPTTDPAAALAGGLLSFGGHKGSALSMMVELLAAPLIGEAFSADIARRGVADSGPPPGGALLIALDPAVFNAEAMRQAESFFAAARAQRGVRLPSDRRYAARARTLAAGVDVPETLYRQIAELMAPPSEPGARESR